MTAPEADRYPPPQCWDDLWADSQRVSASYGLPWTERWIPETLLTADFDRSKGESAIIREVMRNRWRLERRGRCWFTSAERHTFWCADWARARMKRAGTWRWKREEG